MADVEFDEQQNDFTSRRILGDAVVPGMTKLLMKSGFVKDENQAKYYLLGIIGLCIGLTIAILYLSFSSSNQQLPSTKIQAMKEMMSQPR